VVDQHIRRGGEEYADGFAALLPRGPAWPREADSVLMRLVRSLAEVWGGRIDPRAADLLERESDPRSTVELLDDWERVAGLPDPCLAEPLSIADRQKSLVARLSMLGSQSIPFFTELARAIGYEILIVEHAPFMAGVSRVGDTRDLGNGSPRWEIGPPEIRFYWSVRIINPRLSWFRAGSGQAGVDPHLRIGFASDLECVLRRFKPAHTEISFDYSGLAADGAMAGTP
jgi:uncharacterized protein YmfQ (DUF2313 family)